MRGLITTWSLAYFILMQVLTMHRNFFLQFVQCQQVFENDYSDINATHLNDITVLNRFTQFVYQRLNSTTSHLIHSQIAKRASFCVTDPQDDWNRSFNFSDNLEFLSKCIKTTQGDLPRRICTAPELQFYYTNYITSNGFVHPNKNCNVSSWHSGCEPGWACSSALTEPVTDLIDSKELPPRTSNCQPCCEGFFCPQGLTCMIPCPLGSYCPLATFEDSTGLCKPYNYQLPPGRPNHTCGGAHIWSDVGRSKSIFCPAGSYCPTNTQETSCGNGHYCLMGSTTETRCFRLTSCDSSTRSQNITQHGLMLIVAISAVLFMFYTCYGQVTTIREKRYARSRENAVKSVKENVQAQATWLAAKHAIIRAIEVQSQLSRSFSRRNVIQPTEEQPDVPSECNLDGHSPNQANEEHNSIVDVVDPTKENKVSEKRLTAKHARSDTQIFKYAYAQLEMEKAHQLQDKDLTFSEVVSMAIRNEIKRRPPIAISFRDLTVTLKQKKKHLLRSLTGEILPSRITALMGPSGAGKTTLLSALAGKTVGCSVTGSILINGKTELIRSYKKIVGFVPQDDIVHGNLTVEENIWFSANCRLSADLPKPDKVLVVERVIESLGLQPVRGSLVGTVEKRGISGGQRKRVNVGLELVIEPSLLFLDEPTSGLDSSSSQLLLRALRREALEGVNICIVVHQPSYSLFKMFDDLILLAKGGRAVYHGPVRDVEDYFSHLGINVPERVNPPDYFIDVLEDMVQPCTTKPLVSCDELPLKWMLHKGYHVPRDMASTVSETDAPVIIIDSSSQEHDSGPPPEQLSFCGEFWQTVNYNMEGRFDVIRNNFFNPKDLSGRRTPCILVQYGHCLGRMAKQRLREARIQVIDYLILLLAGACLGLTAKGTDINFGAPGYTYTIIATSLLVKIAALRTFSLDKLQYRRERASGISSLAHFVAKDTVDHFNTLIKPLMYLSTFYFFNDPRSTFLDNYFVMLCLFYCVTGIAYILAIFLEPGPAQLCSVLLPVVLTLTSTQRKDTQFIKTVAELCYPSWALEAFIISNAKRYYGVWLIHRCGALLKTGYDLHNWNHCITLLMATGAACRGLAFFCMLALQKK